MSTHRSPARTLATGRAGYRPVDAALLRASAHTDTIIPLWWPDRDGPDGVSQMVAWLDAVRTQPQVAEAVAAASPVLADRIEAIRHGPRPDPARLGRVVLSVARYLVRMRGRATPFGLLAGVAPIALTTPADAGWGDGHRVQASPDASWLGDVITRLEACTALRQRLHVAVNNLNVVRGDRLVVAWQPHAADQAQTGPAEISLRHTPAVQTVLHAARRPVTVAELQAMFLVAPTSAAAMIAQLIRYGALISNLRPTSTDTDGLGGLLDRLHALDAANIPEIAGLVDELHLIDTQLHTACHGDWADGRARRITAAGMRTITDRVDQPQRLDLRLDTTLRLPGEVAAEAAHAADVLARLATRTSDLAGWRAYHARFLDRYGLGAIVSVTDLVDQIAGLGYPTHFTADEDRDSRAGGRHRRLLALAQQAALDGAREVVLDAATITTLAGDEVDGLRPAAHLDICVDIRAATFDAIGAGAFTLAVTGIGQTAMATSGRFLDLLPDADQQRMTGQYATLPTGVAGAVAAQLSFPPHTRHAGNVVRAPQLLPHLIRLAEYGDGATVIALHDLAVTADTRRLYLLSRSRRRVVEPVAAHAGARHTMPPLARLLADLPRMNCVPVQLLDWGPAAGLPFRPRLRYRRTILSPARWQIPTGGLPGPAATDRAWAAAWTVLHERAALPSHVYIGAGDQRLRLCLDEAMDLAVLRAQVAHTDAHLTVTEAPTAADHAWLGGRAHEIVIPLAATVAPLPAPAVVASGAPLTVTGRDHGSLPGGEVLSARLYTHPDVIDVIVTGHLPALLDGWAEPPMWWFLRYRDPAGDHLRLRLQPVVYGDAAERVGAWAAGLRRDGLVGDLVFDSYRPETGRYGHGPALTAAEALFAADSAAAAAQLSTLAATPAAVLHPMALTAASLVDLAAAVTGDPDAGMRWLLAHPDLAGPGGASDRTIVRQAIALADPHHPHLSEFTDATTVAEAWQARRAAATVYAAHLPDSGPITADTVTVSLLHLHYNRTHGIDPAAEARTHRVARAVALATVNRRTRRSNR